MCSIISESVKYIALLHIIVTYIKENIISKLQKLYSPPRNLKAGNKSRKLFLKNVFARAIYCPAQNHHWKALFFKAVCLNFILSFINKNQEPPLERTLPSLCLSFCMPHWKGILKDTRKKPADDQQYLHYYSTFIA